MRFFVFNAPVNAESAFSLFEEIIVESSCFGEKQSVWKKLHFLMNFEIIKTYFLCKNNYRISRFSLSPV